MNNKQIQALKEEVERLQKLLKVSGKIEIFEVVAIAEDIKEIAENPYFE
jgi:hypothetical protein